MEMALKGKRALVTGSSSGLGAAIALKLAAEGVNVVVHGRDSERTNATVAQIVAEGGKAVAAIGDLTSDDAADHVASVATRHFGVIDILVNNAGGLIDIDRSDWLERSSTDWFDSYNLNVISAVRLAQRLSPGMVAQGWGRIINISSLSGTMLRGKLFDYGAAKAALNSFTVNLSKELAPKGITVNSIVPGAIMTPAIRRWIESLRVQNGWPDDFADNEKRYLTGARAQPVPRLGQPDEIATAVTLLASPLSGYTTGACLRIDGGVSTSMGV